MISCFSHSVLSQSTLNRNLELGRKLNLCVEGAIKLYNDFPALLFIPSVVKDFFADVQWNQAEELQSLTVYISSTKSSVMDFLDNVDVAVFPKKKDG